VLKIASKIRRWERDQYFESGAHRFILSFSPENQLLLTRFAVLIPDRKRGFYRSGDGIPEKYC
ncbi:hypothetical protein, partial [Leptospira ellisii]|uniref:hypothetical protein n=1 Tax=Leptospira ellisii TaxID=2023197 RepID=UPI000CBDBE1A